MADLRGAGTPLLLEPSRNGCLPKGSEHHLPMSTAWSERGKRGRMGDMRNRAVRENALIRTIRSLPPEKVAEVEDFVEFLRQREDRQLTRAAGKLAEAFRRVWDNPADAAYDRL